MNTIANNERRGRLHVRHAYRADSRGIEHRMAVYDPKELLKLPHPPHRPEPARQPGEVAARCFELLDQGKSVREIVVELRETPDQVQTLRERWLDSGGADLLITPTVKEKFETLVGNFTSVTDLFEMVARALVRGDGAKAAI